MAESGNYEALVEAIKGKMEAAGATAEDLRTVDYFSGLAGHHADSPEWQAWIRDMILWTGELRGGTGL